MIPPEDIPCPNCQAVKGEAHRAWDDTARCYYTGIQLIQCGWHPDDEDEIEDEKRELYYQMHPNGTCAPDIWDGDWPGVNQCRELGWYTDPDSIYGGMEDLNALSYASFFSDWDVENQKWIISEKVKKFVDKKRKTM